MMKSAANVVFFGSDRICLPFLDFLLEEGVDHCRLAAVISQPDRRQGRGHKLSQNPVAEWATRRGVALWQPEKPDAALVESLIELETVVGFVMAYGHFLPKSLRHAPTYGLVNFHGSILPAYRGASPVETALAEGESITGISLMKVVREMDAGGVADVEEVPIEPSDTAAIVRAKVGASVVPLMRRNLSAAITGSLRFVEQNAALVTHCRKITKEDGALDFTLPAEKICARLRAFTPWPGGYFTHNGEHIKLGASSYSEEIMDVPPGTVLASSGNADLRIVCQKGVLLIHELQRPGGRMLPVADFLRGYPLAPGLHLPSVPVRSLVV